LALEIWKYRNWIVFHNGQLDELIFWQWRNADMVLG